ncbi:MAG: hypothetical protein CL681_05190 [Blastopirellula sp.]|nr:hypothetical protein [Blastopirellula sp.]
MSLAVNDAAQIETPLPSLFSREPQEDLCIGHDNGNPVDQQAPQGSFNGKLVKLQITTGR